MCEKAARSVYRKSQCCFSVLPGFKRFPLWGKKNNSSDGSGMASRLMIQRIALLGEHGQGLLSLSCHRNIVVIDVQAQGWVSAKHDIGNILKKTVSTWDNFGSNFSRFYCLPSGLSSMFYAFCVLDIRHSTFVSSSLFRAKCRYGLCIVSRTRVSWTRPKIRFHHFRQ